MSCTSAILIKAVNESESSRVICENHSCKSSPLQARKMAGSEMNKYMNFYSWTNEYKLCLKNTKWTYDLDYEQMRNKSKG